MRRPVSVLLGLFLMGPVLIETAPPGAPPVQGVGGPSDYHSPIIHPQVVNMARDFQLCEQVTIGNDTHFIRVGMEDSIRDVARRFLMQRMTVQPSPTSDSGYDLYKEDVLTAFLEHRVSLSMVQRQEFRRHFTKFAKQPPHVLLLPSCGPLTVTKENEVLLDVLRHQDPSLLPLAFNMLNPDRQEDWAWYFKTSRLGHIVVGPRAVEQMVTDEGFRGEVIRACSKYLEEGAPLTLLTMATRSALELYALLQPQGFTRDSLHNRHDLPSLLPSSLVLENKLGLRPTTFYNRVEQVGDTKGDVMGGGLRLAHAYVINLDRRPDRWVAFLDQIQSLGLSTPSFTRIKAADGQALDLVDPQLLSIFNLSNWRYGKGNNPHQDHAYRRNVLGCALSHMEVWDTIAHHPSSDPNEAFLVLEDDVTFVPDLNHQWDQVTGFLSHDYTWQALWLGYFDDLGIYGDHLVHGPSIYQFSGESRGYGAGAFAYVLRKKGAVHLLEVVAQNGIQQAVDWFLFDQFPSMITYFLRPMLALSPSGDHRDSDNDQEYPQARLLLEKHRQQRLPSPKASLTIQNPPDNSQVPQGEAVTALVDVEVTEPSGLFMERHRDSRLCLSITTAAISHHDGDHTGTLTDSRCRSILEPQILLPPLAPGTYSLWVDLVDVNGRIVGSATSSFTVISSSSSSSDLYSQVREECVARVMPHIDVPFAAGPLLQCMMEAARAAPAGIPVFGKDDFLAR